ncbi:proline dehydrogenase family protein [Lentisphaera profundi]|uniref:L-glutamate gamma-semialdehyde dehydrogenase n=1 Tax=Lentisphaera profundi TaxID=1658616 RepID=A0ABY7VZ13_9BACT|nr:proline dehydrogenase family protein [Lentisphaera profundi]WDE98519.1 proline dehydrogenase family protein [Lentisphaera profundi]
MNQNQDIERILEFVKSANSPEIKSSLERGQQAVDLSRLILEQADKVRHDDERLRDEELARMFDDPQGKAFSTAMHDQCFRSENSKRIADQIGYLLKKYGTPSFLDHWARVEIDVFKSSPLFLKQRLVPLIKRLIRKKTAGVIFPGEETGLLSHVQKRKDQGVISNVNRLGEAILGEAEAHSRLETYIADLEKHQIAYMSIKISTIYSQINTRAWHQSVDILAGRLRCLYRAAIKNAGDEQACFINLDMEEYRDLRLSYEVFKEVLDEDEFLQYRAGIVLQAYLPDSYALLEELIAFSQKRCDRGGVPLKLRIVKGANLAMEKLEAALDSSVPAPFPDKLSVDSHFKKMLHLALRPENVRSLNIGIASHNLFDLSYALLLIAENGVEAYCEFEMLEGMAPHIHRIINLLSGKTVLYCPAARASEFNNAMAYLIRRLDEQSAEENFLRHSFKLLGDQQSFAKQSEFFLRGIEGLEAIDSSSRRNHLPILKKTTLEENFHNEMNTDFVLESNIHRLRGETLKTVNELLESSHPSPIPLIINGQEIHSKQTASGISPDTGKEFYDYSLADAAAIEKTLRCAQNQTKLIVFDDWPKRADKLLKVAEIMRHKRFHLCALLMADVGKSSLEADGEVSEAIDFCEYYARSMAQWQHLPNLKMQALGSVLICSPWNFPLAIPTGGIAAALIMGNACVFKPAPEAVLVGYELLNIFHQAGFDPCDLQFVSCEDEPQGSSLIKDSRIDAVVLTGATETAQYFMKMRPGLHLMAETGGKNTMIISELSDRDLAIKDLVDSAFAYSGQKCSACSLAFIHQSLYQDPKFLETLKDAAQSRTVGQVSDQRSFITPLIQPAQGKLLHAIESLEKAETWLLKPVLHEDSAHLVSPGIKLGVTPESVTYRTELFGPVLGLVVYEDLEEAIELINAGDYGLTGGIHSLDEREQQLFLEKVEVGNTYICRGITGAMVERQAFGGYKNSSFGRGFKAGGPNYLLQFCQIHEQLEHEHKCMAVHALGESLQEFLSKKELDFWSRSIASYQEAYEDEFSQNHDQQGIAGQANIFRYRKLKVMHLALQSSDSILEVCQVLSAAQVAGVANLRVFAKSTDIERLNLQSLIKIFTFELNILDEDDFSQALKVSPMGRIRLIHQAPEAWLREAAERFIPLQACPVYSTGRLELLHYFHSQSLSIDYHRYGNSEQGFSLS